MNHRKAFILLSIILLFGNANSVFASPMKVFLMRENVADSDMVTLGMISVISGEDEALKEELGNVGLGIISMTGQELVVDRSTIKARLASSGFDDSDIELVGAKTTKIKRFECKITSEEFVKTATEFLKTKLDEKTFSNLKALNDPAELVLKGKREAVKLVCELSSKSFTGRANVIVNVYRGSEKITFRDVNLKMQYQGFQAVATKAISKSEILSKDNVRIEEVALDAPNAEGFMAPYGKAAMHNIRAGSVVKSNMFENVREEVIVKRNQLVDIKYETPLLLVSALGQAVEDGKAGQIIKVANVKMDDNGRVVRGRVIVARVQNDGSLTPVY